MNQLEFVISPNASLSRQANIALFASLAGIILTVSIGFTVMGYWLVLPFAGIELAALAAVLVYVDYQNQYREIVSVDELSVKVATGYRRAQQAWEAQRHWTTVLMSSGRSPGHPGKLLLRSGGRQVEIGACLVQEERADLWRELKQIIEQPRLD